MITRYDSLSPVSEDKNYLRPLVLNPDPNSNNQDWLSLFIITLTLSVPFFLQLSKSFRFPLQI